MKDQDNNLTADQRKLNAFIDKCVLAYCAFTHQKVLFEEKESDRKLFEKISHQFFWDLNHILRAYSNLQICSLTDPAFTVVKKEKKENLTINNLLETIDWPTEIKDQLDGKANQLNTFREKIVSARNKIIAHADCEAHFTGETLGGFVEGEDKEFFKVLGDAVNIMHEHLIGGPYDIRPTNAFEPAHKFLVKLRTLEQ
ncbi:MAG: hypothetical protein JKY23_05760 [Nitrospinaceae bacterium]|nr:hypothetical protein [Nitrospinaceae bacterium]